MKNYIKDSQSARIVAGIILAVMLVILTTLIIYSAGSSTPPVVTIPSPIAVQNEQKEKMDLNVSRKYSASLEPTIKVANLNSFEWKNCGFAINDTFKKEGSLMSTSSLIRAGVEDGQHTFYPRMFTKNDGTKFDPDTTSIITFTAYCREPYTGFYGGKFSN